MNDQERPKEKWQTEDPFSGEKEVPHGTGVGGAAGATAGAAIGGMGAIAAGATAGSAVGPIGAAVGAAIGAVLGTALEHNVEHKSNPTMPSGQTPAGSFPRSAARTDEDGTSIRELSRGQQEALLDLTVLAMYADGHLATAEETGVRRLLELMGHTTDDDRARHYDAAVVRTRQHLATPEDAGRHAETLVKAFSAPGEKRLVREVLQDFLGSDGRLGTREGQFLSSAERGLQTPAG